VVVMDKPDSCAVFFPIFPCPCSSFAPAPSVEPISYRLKQPCIHDMYVRHAWKLDELPEQQQMFVSAPMPETQPRRFSRALRHGFVPLGSVSLAMATAFMQVMEIV
jgi:hypothetical protein